MSDGPFAPGAIDRQGAAPHPSDRATPENRCHFLSRMILAAAIVLSALTALALVTLDFVEWRQQRAAALSRVVTNLQLATEDYFAGYAKLFHTVAETEVLHSRDAAAGSALFRRLQKHFPEVVNIAAAGADGRFFASSRPLAAEPPDVAELPFFRELAAGAPLYVMEAHTGPLSGETVTGLVVPLRDGRGRFTGALGASIALAELSRIWDEVSLPPGYAFTILDRNGSPLFTAPEFPLTLDEVHALQRAAGAAPPAEDSDFRLETVPVAAWTLLATTPPGKVPDYLRQRPMVWGLGLSILLLSAAGLLLAGRQGHLCRQLYENKERLRRHGEELEKQIETRTTELAVSEGRYRQIIETAQEGIWVIDAAGDTTFVNPHMAAMLGYDEGEMEGQSLFVFIAEEDHSAAREHLARRRAGLGDRCEFRFRRKDGSILWTFLSATPLFDAAGSYSGSLGMVMDISERLQIERDLRNSQRLLKLILSSLPTRVFWKDRELNYLGGNEAFARDAGLSSPEELVGKDDFAMPWPEQAERYRADDRKVIESGEPLLGYEEPQPNPEGRMMRVRTCKLPLLDADGDVVGVIGTYEDITEQKGREEQLQHLATHDALTGLANRTLLHDRIDQAVHFAQRAGRVAAVLLLDLDGFKAINDTLGHDFGDKLLCTAAQRLKQSVRETDTVARLGGDEFVVVLAQVDGAQHVRKVASKIFARLTAPCRIDGREVPLGCSFGISLFPHDSADGATLLRYADQAMYRAKQSRTGIAMFSNDPG